MAQRILEPGQIETLSRGSIPRLRLPDRATLFTHRAARFRSLAAGSPLAEYLRFLAMLAEAQQNALDALGTAIPPVPSTRTRDERMPPIHAPSWPRPPEWRTTLELVCAPLAAASALPAEVRDAIRAVRVAEPAWIEARAQALLESGKDIEPRTAPFVMAALQVHWVALAGSFPIDAIEPPDLPGLCPLCGTLPVASLVRAHAPHQGYRYLHCALCASEWHLVRVQCSHCGASGPDIAYHSLDRGSGGGAEAARAAVRAETCEKCRAYRKILYQEHDPQVEPVADDVASIALDLLLGERGYHRASPNPMLWLTSPNPPV
jgi:FdhE protein